MPLLTPPTESISPMTASPLSQREESRGMFTEAASPTVTANWELIEKTLVNIEHSPDNFNMEYWVDAADSVEQARASIPLCGTVMCFAGWVVYTAGIPIDWVSADTCAEGEIEEVATELLGVDVQEANRLFASEFISEEVYGMSPVYTAGDLRDRITQVLGKPE